MLGALGAAITVVAGCAHDTVRAGMHVQGGSIARGRIVGQRIHLHNDGPDRAQVTLTRQAGREASRSILGAPGEHERPDFAIESRGAHGGSSTCVIRGPGAGIDFELQPSGSGD